MAYRTLLGYVEGRIEPGLRTVVTNQLDAWYKQVVKASWKTSAELKEQFRSASIVSAERVVFNIKGNDYRLVTSISYEYRTVYVIWLGTHREYDKIDAVEIEYEKRRYSGPPDSH